VRHERQSEKLISDTHRENKMNLSKLIRQYPVASFIALTLGLSFAAMLLPFPKDGAFAMIASLMVLIPTLVACVLVTVIAGRKGLRAFLREVFNWHMSLKWAVIAFALGFMLHFGSSLLALVTGRIPAIEIVMPNAFFIAVFPLALFEEIGWRGFALQRLLDRHSPFTATVLIGFPWALLHFALFLGFAPGTSPIAEMLVVFTFALPLTWVYVRSGRNVLVATVLHGALNAFGIVAANIPPAGLLWFVLASAILIDAGLVLIDRRTWFTRPTETPIDEALHLGHLLAQK
jgi:membrane protease YdiL (CAAX protease family)